MCCKCECTCKTTSELMREIETLNRSINFTKRANEQWKEQNLILQRDLGKAKTTVRELRTTIKTLITFKEEENVKTSS